MQLRKRKPTASLEKEEGKKSSRKASEPLPLIQTARDRHPICTYPATPHVYYKKGLKEIATQHKGSKRLRLLFAPSSIGIIYLPKDLVELCISYYEEQKEGLIDRTIADLFRLSESGFEKLIGDLFESVQTESMEYRNLKRLATHMDRRASEYLYWFQLRRLVPLKNSIPGVQWTVIKKCFDDPGAIARMTIVGTDIQSIVTMRFNNNLALPLFEFPAGSLGQSFTAQRIITDLPLIATNLKMSRTLFSEIITKTDLEQFIFFTCFAAIQLWTSDAANFAHLPKPAESQNISKMEWNRLCTYFAFGAPLSLL